MKIDRIIPLWGLVTVAGAIAGQAVLLWQGQREQAIEQGHMTKQVGALAAEVKAMSAQIAAKDSKDVVQDAQIADHERRLLKLETAR